ncbi:ATP-dependent RNA helicase DHX30 [Chanos chanos]|uniref:ATP-dependent RNA helicase DHX30 n=1 Tax=Chanos chanos TaxID=29144 RepID=A0A6J2VEU5_CHACN|nr:ATP-dependent RNA helicase DHX30 [Chanos chanos]
MAAPCTGFMCLRMLCNLGNKTFETSSRLNTNWTWVKRYRTKVGADNRSESGSEKARGHPDLLREYPEPKSLLHNTLSKSLGLSDPSKLIRYHCTDGQVKRATVTLFWPQKIEVEGFGSRRIDAERCAAAAACHRLRELGVLGPGNEALWKGADRGLGSHTSHWKDLEEDLGTHRDADNIQHHQRMKVEGQLEEDPRVSLALSMFSTPKLLLSKVIQTATCSSRVRELVRYRTAGGKVKTCDLMLYWPEEMIFTAKGRRKLEAETRAAALACLRLKELELLDSRNNPLTHAQYHREEVREVDEREKRPCHLEIPEDLENRIKQYLSKYPVEAQMQKIWDEEEERAMQQQFTNDEEDEDDIIDTISGQPYHPLPPEEASLLSDCLRSHWERAGPGLGAELPVDSHRERLVAAVESSQVVVVAGETGCGKTTRIPRFLLEGRVRAGDGANCNILVTQPRRISAVSVANRVAQEMGPALRHHVGYQVRLESRPPESSGGALLFLTVGVLLRKLQGNPALQGVSHVVVDEVHERDVNTDLLLALLRSALQENPDLRVVLMSATGDTQRLTAYFGDCPVISVPGFMYPVRERFLEDLEREMGRRLVTASSKERQTQSGDDDNDATPDVDLVADVISHVHTHGEPGAVLCFLPGWQDIKAVQQKLEERPAYRSGSQLILPLHSSMAVADQQAVFQHPLEGQRKIVLATNIAETSITIDDIVHVVDTGAQKEQSYDPRTKVSCLDTVWVSRSNVTQRRGRAGRCQPGHAYHLFPRKWLNSMTTFPIPEILRIPLENLVVQAKIHSPQSKAVDFLSQVMDAPQSEAVRDAVRNLQEIGVLDRFECLTPLGERVACMSCDPRLGKVLVLSVLFSCVLPALSVAACLTRDPFHNSLQNRAFIIKAKQALCGDSCSDYVVCNRVVQGWREKRDRQSRQEYLDTHTLSGASLRFIHGLMQQFSENLCEAQLVENSTDCLRLLSQHNQHSQEEELLKAVIMAGLYPNLIHVKKGTVTKTGRFRPDRLSYHTQRGRVLMHRSTVNRDQDQLPSRWLMFFNAVKSNDNVFIRDSSVVHPLAVLLLTDCDLAERVLGDRVQVALPGRSLIRWEMRAQTWEVLWDLRSSIQAMLHRKLQPSLQGSQRDDAASQDEELVSLLVDLLNKTPQQTDAEALSDSE